MNLDRLSLVYGATAIALLCLCDVFGGETLILASRNELDWWGQPVLTPVATPRADQWKRTSGLGYARNLNVADSDLGRISGVWKKRELFIPSSWRGAYVRFVQGGLNEEDLILFVNGNRVGEILRPAGELDVSKHLRPGETNVIQVYLSQSGEGTARGRTVVPEKWYAWSMGPREAARLEMTRSAALRDVFANTSWRKKQISFEVDVWEPRTRASKARIEVSVYDQDGCCVGHTEMCASLCPGANDLELRMPFNSPVCWELGRGYLYTAKVSIRDVDSGMVEKRDFNFGFREIWRDGRNLIMNGHPLHFRPCYAFYGTASNTNATKFIQSIGFNVLTLNHNIDPIGNGPDKNVWDWMDRNGMGVIVNPGAFPAVDGGDWNTLQHFATNTVKQQAYRDYISYWHRKNRNRPSLFAAYVAQMIICDIGNFHPGVLAQQKDSVVGKARSIEVASDINREFNPNILYYSHADGSCADLSTGNLYLNWTPLEERENWLSKWACEGTWPWHSAEFGQPYDGSWYNCRGKIGISEYAAMYFGDWAYEVEPMNVLTNCVRAGQPDVIDFGHGSPLGLSLQLEHPAYWAVQRLWTKNTNRAWRGFGHGGGNIYFNLGLAYGKVPGSPGSIHDCGYQFMSESNYFSRTTWVNPAYEIYRQGNGDFCGFIGGWPEHTDKTHAYYSGETIRKQYVLIWDGPGETNVMGRTLRTGDIVKIPFEIIAPEVDRVQKFRHTCGFDTFEYEVYPRLDQGVFLKPFGKSAVALLDPTGEGAVILKAMQIPFRKVESALGVRDALVVGPYALDKALLEINPEDVRNGLRVLILNQRREIWESLGFKVMDTASRILFTRYRDLGFSDEALRYWRGSPTYDGRNVGPYMSHQSPRGPRWVSNHAIALFTFQIPDEVGFEPLLEGEFDMAYTAALRVRAGKGSVTYSTLEFKDRIPDDPAATATACALVTAAFGPLPAVCAQSREEVVSRIRNVLAVPKNKTVWRIMPTDAQRQALPWLDRIGPNLLRWPKPVAHEIPERCTRFWSRILTVAGFPAETLSLQRVLTMSGMGDFSPLPAFNVMGPYLPFGREKSVGGLLDRQFEPVESMAIAGDANPNNDYDMPQGGKANWRPSVSGDESGHFDLSRIFPSNAFQMAYATCVLERREAGMARINLGFDWSGRVWVNGHEVFRTHSGSRRAQFELRVPLCAGRNVIAVKTVAGAGGGLGFWGLIENESKIGLKAALPEALDHSLYHETVWEDDPWSYYYW